MDALFQAMQANDREEIRRLVQAGADINARGWGKLTLLDHAYGWDKLTPLMMAIGHEDMKHRVETATIAVLLELGAHPNQQFEIHGTRTPLSEACLGGRSDVARLLVQYGADPFWHYPHGSILHAAAQGGINWLVRDILDRGGDVNARDDEGEMPLHEAVYGGQISVCQMLIERGADVNARITGGSYIEYTPLQFALERGSPHITELLLRAGAVASLSAASPLRNLLHRSQHKGRWPAKIKQDVLFLLLQEHHQELDTSRHAADPWVMSVRSFLQACPEVPAEVREQARDLLPSIIKGNLYDAVAQDDEQEVRFLLTQLKERGLWEEVSEDEKGKLLFAAVENENVPIVQMLLEHGIDTNTDVEDLLESGMHSSASRYAARAAMVSLMEAVADPNTVKDVGLLEKALAAGEDMMARLFLKYGARSPEENGA